MAAFHIHALVGLSIGLVAQSGACPQAGYPMALWSHIPLDDLNTDPETTWYHGYGEGWHRTLYVAFTALCTLVVVYLCWRSRYLIPYVICACLPDLEHPVRWLLNKQDYWLHNIEVMFWRPLRGQWGMLAWAIVAVLMVLMVWR